MMTEPRVITHGQPATTGHLSARDRLTAVSALLSGLTRDLFDGLIRLTPSEAADILEHVGDVEQRFARLRTVIVHQQGVPDPGDGTYYGVLGQPYPDGGAAVADGDPDFVPGFGPVPGSGFDTDTDTDTDLGSHVRSQP
jgi:hypothetical protein